MKKKAVSLKKKLIRKQIFLLHYYKPSNYHLKILSTLSMILILMVFGCEKSNNDEMTLDEIINANNSTNLLKSTIICEVSLLAAQDIPIGTVFSEFNDAGNQLTVIYTLTDPEWCIIETHLDVQIDPGNFPMTPNGNPKVGQFAYGANLSCETIWSQSIDLTTINGWEEGVIVYIAAKASVQKENHEEGAWGEGESFLGNNWAMYFSCEPPSFECGDPLIDSRDDQVYNTVQIGDQCWMAENMNIGILLNNNYGSTDNGEIEKYCFENEEEYCEIYGGLYQWDEMMCYSNQPGSQGICPSGWHIPSDMELKILEGTVDSQFGLGNPIWDEVGWRGYDNGGNLKEAGCEHFCPPNLGSTNSSGFTALPHDNVVIGSPFAGICGSGYFWSSDEINDSDAWFRKVKTTRTDVARNYFSKSVGISVRCIKD